MTPGPESPPPSAGPRLTPARVRATQFPRAAVGRRGYSAEAVDQFVRRMAEEITVRDASEANLRAQLDRMRRALKQWQTRVLERRESGLEPAGGPATRSVEAVTTLSAAQQQADAYIAQAQEYCRQITADARNRADAILCEAQERAEATAAAALRSYEAQTRQAAEEAERAALVPVGRGTDDSLGGPPAVMSGGGPGSGEGPAVAGPAGPGGAGGAGGPVIGIDAAELERRLSWARTFVATLQSVEAQLTTSREALKMELDALDRMRPPCPASAPAPLAELGTGRPPGSS